LFNKNIFLCPTTETRNTGKGTNLTSAFWENTEITATSEVLDTKSHHPIFPTLIKIISKEIISRIPNLVYSKSQLEVLDVFHTQVEKGVCHEFLSSLIKTCYQGQLQKSYLQDSVPYSELASVWE